MGKETSRKDTKNVRESSPGLNHPHLCVKGAECPLNIAIENDAQKQDGDATGAFRKLIGGLSVPNSVPNGTTDFTSPQVPVAKS